MIEKDSYLMVIEHQETFIKHQQETISQSFNTTNVAIKELQKTIKFIVLTVTITLAIMIVVILASFFVNYFKTGYSNEVKEAHSNYNYNENINTSNK